MSSDFDYDLYVGCLLEMLDSGESLSDEDISDMLCNTETISEEVTERSRWYNETTTIVELKGRHFAIEWRSCLSETGENEYPNQPYEVEEVEEKRLVWRRKNR